MKKAIKILAVILTLALTLSLVSCVSADKEDTESENIETVSPSGALQGIYDVFLTNDDYSFMKEYYPNTSFSEQLSDDSIVITVSGSDGIGGTYTYPMKDGYIVCEISGDDYMEYMLFNYIVSSVGEYYDINNNLFTGYINGLGTLGISSDDYITETGSDGSGTISVRADKKPEMSELDQLYINDAVLSSHSDDTDQFIDKIGKLLLSVVPDSENGTLAIAIGEYGENTELTYKSIVNIVEFYKPTGYEDFLKEFTELKEISSDSYTVSSDSTEFASRYAFETCAGYKFMFVIFGE